MFVKLIKLANRAKTVNEYDLANAVFAVLLNKYFGLLWGEREAHDGPPVAWLTWETKDVMGDYPSEVYYDLLVIEAAEPLENGYKLHALNIPVPLLNSSSAITALKGARIIDRLEHGREHEEPGNGEIEGLWESFLGSVDGLATVEADMGEVLDREECELVFERVLTRLETLH